MRPPHPHASATSGFDLGFFLPMVALTALGLLGIYAADVGTGQSFFLRQFVWAVLGLIAFFLVFNIPYERYRQYAEHIYGVNLILLAVTLALGMTMRNTRGWISLLGVNFQFSETAKISMTLLLAKHLASYEGSMDRPKDFLPPVAILLAPMLLILLQPDLGTALVLLPIWAVLFFLSGVNDLFITLATAAAAVSVTVPLWMSYYQITDPESPFALYRFFQSPTAVLFVLLLFVLLAILAALLHLLTNKPAWRRTLWGLLTLLASYTLAVGLFHFLKPYHKRRFLAFLDPEIDRLGAGYNIIQSTISIGSGGLTGKGFLKGSQSLLGFLPAQNTDFIFSVLAEQFGFLLSAAVFGLFALVILKGFQTVATAKDGFGALTAAGLTTYLLVHVTVNIGMATGLMPIIGLPLPFMSYGGSSLVTSMLSVAVLMNIRRRRFVHA